MMKLLASPTTRRILLGKATTRNLRRVLPCATATTNNARACFSTAADDTQNNGQKPFDKVMIANRGEIVQRVVRTCRELDIATVAVYSTADAQAPFVREADQAICLGPAAANQSYLNTSAILKAIDDTGTQAVHPGYGFLSENAGFAQLMTDHGVTWLGPPAQAIREMGDKLASKDIALAAGVNIVPGHDKPLESVEQALQMCNDGTVPYPVLIKAAAGGGGKGMRVCYNDEEVKEAWRLSKAEALQFFSDDRLLLEKFIEEPHHIEFQIMATATPDGGTDVVVFPERDCSIQRRNQKVIEESPSIMLNDQTRRAMTEQVVRLCQAVGYQSAGTIEFLVDKDQNFYFLEMNTRLQVEHCVSEQACQYLENGTKPVDLVKSMLWVGAGWGFPEEIQEIRDGHMIHPTHHAIEARIYAEDPLRGYLPSTGPLWPYGEPQVTPTVRVDSGVTEGHVVTPFYDPMLSKVISSGKTRGDAIAHMLQAMDEYVIEGVQHNARLIQGILRKPAFATGDAPTSFLPTQFPDGFQGVELTASEKEEFAVAAVAIDKQRRSLLQQPTLAGNNGDPSLIVRLGGFFGQPYRVTTSEDGTSATVRLEDSDDSTVRTIALDEPAQLDLERYLAQVSLDGSSKTIQVLGQDKSGTELKMQMHGADTSIVVQSPREYELSLHMQEPEEVDTSSLVLSPMPGALISFAVQAGDEVEEGQELCIVEAMKMQNIIKSPKHGVISGLKVKVGDSLMTDQVIMEFEVESE
mmetsp:Transcript_21688/g.60193  ORF Transcript_21688/g.60193 Transcript_21688/m.60193 type:complete len:750 (+) Transcript_21688:87-2336(+)|eukprot:CAMPEP_0168735050 /NCGR_PEP_ID=MMETSP0724-20121128/9131_1 /TAXON_ID=265536 /ORGANISM="Amphiprora sp., Strain CCMP467" /LENGTH=749 /DNA_ID=CAMNT_0008782177 /DNA_START=239 /DNA_END=2488 /DNA_ORIENTATION=+